MCELQVSNWPGPVKLTFQYEEKAKATDWPQYKGLECRATDAWTRDNGTVLQVANAKSVDDTMYHPTISVPLVYGPQDCGIFERDFRYAEDLVLRQMDTGISSSGISFEHLTGHKWDMSFMKDLS